MKSLYASCLDLTGSMQDAAYVFSESVLYLVGASGAFEFQKHLKPYCMTRSAKNFRLYLRSQHYTSLSIKLFVLQAFRGKTSTNRLLHLAETYGISNKDRTILTHLIRGNSWFATVVRMHVDSKDYVDSDLCLNNIERQFNQVYPSVLKYVKYITYNKLRFLVKSTNSDYSDYHGELMTKIVQAFHAVVPTKMGDLHLQNYLKRIVHNHAINMIKSGTSLKSGRIISELDSSGNRQFHMLCLSQNQAPLDADGNAIDVEGQDDSAEKFELRFSISEVLDRVKASASEYRFLTLLLGNEDIEFTKWLRLRGLCSEQHDNVDVQNSVDSRRYTEFVSDFLRFSRESTAAFLAALRLQMAWT